MIPFHIERILFRKSSFVRHKWTKAATSAATIATTAATGAAIAPSDVPAAAAFAEAAVSFAPSEANVEVSFPTRETAFPPVTRSGPIAATIAAIFMICCFCSSLKPLNHCVISFTLSTIFVIIG